MNQKFSKHYWIVMVLGTFCYPIFKLFVNWAYPGVEPWYFRMGTLVFGLSFFGLSHFYPQIKKRIDLAFLIVSFITNIDYLILLLKAYGESYENYYFMGSFIVMIVSLISIRNRNHFKIFFSWVVLSYTIYFGYGYWVKMGFVKNDINNMIFISLIALIAYLQVKVGISTDEQLIKTQSDLAEKSAQLIEKSKMAYLGEMAGGIAHEVNNPLQIISASAELIEIQSNESIQTKAIKENVSRIQQIVESLKIFSGDESLRKESLFNPHDSVSEALLMCQEKFEKKNVHIRTFPKFKVLINGSKQDLTKVLLNLLTNSFESLDGSNQEKKQIMLRVDKVGNDVRITVSDNGPEITDKVLARLFQPFFTTKPIGKGTGLGLSVSQGLIQKMNGQLVFSPTPKNFEIKIPIIHQE